MMESKGDQGSLNDTEDKRSHVAGSCNQAAQRVDPVLYHRPYKIHGNSHEKVNHCGNDRHKSGTAEKGKGVWKLDLVKAVMKSRHTQSYDNTSENTHL